MNDFRKLLVRFTSINKLQNFYNLEFKNIKKFKKRNIRINYRKSNKNELVLFGFDKKKKFSTSNINQTELNKIFKKIDSMPLGKKKFNSKSTINNICGLYDDVSTSHCFNDSTHHTCCMLGRKARIYSNESGNPIGKASEESFKKYFNKSPLKNDLTSWCTCIGSKVCSYYANKFNDGTHIKFINHKDKKILAYNFDSRNELELSDEFGYLYHLTPGVETNTNNKKNNINYKKYKY